MLSNALSAIGSRLDSKFVAAYWLPAFVAVLGVIAVIGSLVGTEQIDYWRQSIDSVEKTIVVLFIVLTMTMLAFVLRAMARPIAEIFAGLALPGIVAKWSTDGQLRAKRFQEQMADSRGLPSDKYQRLSHTLTDPAFPADDAALQPTLFGNALATVVEHPRLAYAMEAILWWPRLSPLLPDYFRTTLSAAQSPMMAMLNLCLVFLFLALFGAVVLGVIGASWLAAIIVLVTCLGIAWLCYHAALGQATEFSNLIRVGFDLYRHEILRQMGLETPTNLADERALWRQLTSDLYGIDVPSAQESEPSPKDGSDSSA